MTDRFQELKVLLRKLENAKGHDRNVDAAIANLLIQKTGIIGKWIGARGVSVWPDEFAPPYTASIDDAVALVERLLPGWHWSVRSKDDRGRNSCQIEPPEYSDDPIDLEADTAPLAILGALVLALISLEEEQ